MADCSRAPNFKASGSKGAIWVVVGFWLLILLKPSAVANSLIFATISCWCAHIQIATSDNRFTVNLSDDAIVIIIGFRSKAPGVS